MFKYLRKFYALEQGRRALLLSAFFHLIRAQRLLGRRSFRDWVAGFDRLDSEGKPAIVGSAQLHTAREIGWAVRTAAGRMQRSGSCLAQVVAAQRMMRDEGIGGICYIGADKEADNGADGFVAHAWLMCGDEFVTGEAGHERFTVIGGFWW